MSESTPHFAPLVVLLFLGAIFISAICLIAMLASIVRKSTKLALFSGASLAVIFAGYFMALLFVSFLSHEIILPAGGWKYFCEVDCHVAYSIEENTIAAPPSSDFKHSSLPNGKVVHVRLKTWFDPTTISPQRGDALLTPNPRRVALIDDHRNSYFPIPGSQELSSLSKPLRPGESYTSDFVFDVPRDAPGLRLLILEDDAETRFVIGHENSLLHKKIFLALNSPGTAAAYAYE
jgi:hypothetical protein